MFKYLQGHKTQILSVLTVMLSAVYSMEWIDQKLYLTLLGLFGGGMASTLRHGMQTEGETVVAEVAKVETKVDNVENRVETVGVKVANTASAVQCVEGQVT